MNDADDPVSLFTSILKDFAEESIPSAVPKVSINHGFLYSLYFIWSKCLQEWLFITLFHSGKLPMEITNYTCNYTLKLDFVCILSLVDMLF